LSPKVTVSSYGADGSHSILDLEKTLKQQISYFYVFDSVIILQISQKQITLKPYTFYC